MPDLKFRDHFKGTLSAIVCFYDVTEFVLCFFNNNVFGLGDIRAQSGATIHHFPDFVLFSSHDVRRNDIYVNKPSCLLEGVCKGNPLAR